MRRIGIIAGGLLVLIVLLAGGAMILLRPGFAPAVLADLVKSRTGRDLTVAGVPGFSLWPEPAITLSGVELSTPPGMEPGLFARARELRLKTSFSALLGRRLEVSEVVLVGPRINLLVDAEGRASWDFAPPGGGEIREETHAAGSIAAPLRITDGTLAYLDERSGTALEVTNVDAVLNLGAGLRTLDFGGALNWSGQRVKLDGTVRSLSRLSGDGSPISLNLEAAQARLAFDGRLRMARSASLVGRATVSTPDLRPLAHWAGIRALPANGLRDVRVTAAVEASGARIALSDAHLSIDGMTAEGDLALDLGATPRALRAVLAFDRLNANAYATPEEGVTVLEADDGPRQWSAAPLPLGLFGGLALEARISAGGLAYGRLQTGPLEFRTTLSEKRLTARLDRAALHGGTAQGELILDTRERVPRVALNVSAANLDAAALLKALAGLRAVSGRANARWSLDASGRSLREMIGHLKGTGEIRIVDGSLAALDIASLIEELRMAPVKGWTGRSASESGTGFADLSASFAVADGIATTGDLRLTSARLSLAGSGEIDILRRAIDLKFVPTLSATGDAPPEPALPVPIVARGPWERPQIYPDLPGILENPQAAYTMLKQLPLALPAAKDVGEAANKAAGEFLGDEGAALLDEQGGLLLKDLLGQD